MSHVGISGKVYPGGSSSQCKGPVTYVPEPKAKGRGAGGEATEALGVGEGR